MEPRDDGMESLVRRSLSAPVPSLPPEFEQRVLRELQRREHGPVRFRRVFFGVYGLASMVTSAVVMRGQGLDWGLIAGMILGPIGLVVAVRWTRMGYPSNSCW